MLTTSLTRADASMSTFTTPRIYTCLTDATREAPFNSTQFAENGVEVLGPDFPAGTDKCGLRAMLWNNPNDCEPLLVTEIGNVRWTS